MAVCTEATLPNLLLLFSDVQQQWDLYTLNTCFIILHSFQMDCEQLLELVTQSIQLLK